MSFLVVSIIMHFSENTALVDYNTFYNCFVPDKFNRLHSFELFQLFLGYKYTPLYINRIYFFNFSKSYILAKNKSHNTFQIHAKFSLSKKHNFHFTKVLLKAHWECSLTKTHRTSHSLVHTLLGSFSMMSLKSHFSFFVTVFLCVYLNR